jgi:hypothetical protein
MRGKIYDGEIMGFIHIGMIFDADMGLIFIWEFDVTT